jgi:cytochrome c peroxidase
MAVAVTIPLGLDLYLPVPEDNPLTSGRVALGRRLFTDPILSRDRTMSCATCHDPALAFTDGRPVAIGIRGSEGKRNAPTLVNRAWGRSHFWDGRASSLEVQVTEPIGNPRELGLDMREAVRRLSQDVAYRQAFANVFGDAVNERNVARALASYVRTILSGDSPFDRYMSGDRRALPVDARRGLEVFRGKGNCTSCHVAPTFSDEQFHNTGVAWQNGRWQDGGRAGVTGNAADQGAFKTPTLREVARTGPYMHDGSLPTLEAVVDYYNRGGNRAPGQDPDIKPIRLTSDDRQALVAFLRSLSGVIYEGWR